MDGEHLQLRADSELLGLPQALHSLIGFKEFHFRSASLVASMAAHNAAEATHLALGDGANPAAAP